MPVQLVSWIQLAQPETLLNQSVGHLQLSFGRQNTYECADKCDANGAFIEALSVRSLRIPSTSLVRSSISADQEVVGNVVPAIRVHMKCLDSPNLEYTFGLKYGVLLSVFISISYLIDMSYLCGTLFGCSVRNNHSGSWHFEWI